ncbi:MAG: radical SAM protein [Flavobacteriales bacterium]|nr:radical SAM protein [Flavobacteriales bacterium]
MSILFDEIVFGPLHSRRYGHSLGINLLPLDNKVCNYNCIYCECGWTDLKKQKIRLTPFDQVKDAVEQRFAELNRCQTPVDHITFAGNGEPTMHPDFARVVDLVHTARSNYLPDAQTVVLSNGTLLSRPDVYEALTRVDKPTLKLDTVNEHYYRLINQPYHAKSIETYIKQLMQFGKHLFIQTMFLRGKVHAELIDNTQGKEVAAWLETLVQIQPQAVVIYSLDRETPLSGLGKISTSRLAEISGLVNAKGISCTYY